MMLVLIIIKLLAAFAFAVPAGIGLGIGLQYAKRIAHKLPFLKKKHKNPKDELEDLEKELAAAGAAAQEA
jgi:hypothetical protein